ncbi:4'-phosphopantetheinyl transferase superfamily [Scheffersomyces coipomensis]|uniref:4'-phosphopantetheinyl transferase superfamily n=1 Tax=Scheffersomyces coipomensis TaxID=1788519 RepID=UPI00315D43D6
MIRFPVTRAIGVDVTSISRFKKLLEKNNDFVERLSLRLLHPKYELNKFVTLRKNHESDQLLLFLAGTWASKEALYKSLDISDQRSFEFKHWYRSYDENGKPLIQSDIHTTDEFLLSLSHDQDTVVANVIRQQYITIPDITK